MGGYEAQEQVFGKYQPKYLFVAHTQTSADTKFAILPFSSYQLS
jgi:hypothetical protein